MLSLYYPPFRADDDVELLDLAVTGIRAYIEDLSEFPASVLEVGWRACRRDHRTERWPTIGAIREACLAQRPATAPPSVRRQDRKSVERWPFAPQAYEALETAQGQWCLRHSCGLAYWERIAEGAVRKDERGNRIQIQPPQPRDTPLDPREVREIHDAVQRNRESVASGAGGPFASRFAAIWHKRETRESHLAAQYLNSSAAA